MTTFQNCTVRLLHEDNVLFTFVSESEVRLVSEARQIKGVTTLTAVVEVEVLVTTVRVDVFGFDTFSCSHKNKFAAATTINVDKNLDFVIKSKNVFYLNQNNYFN